MAPSEQALVQVSVQTEQQWRNDRPLKRFSTGRLLNGEICYPLKR